METVLSISGLTTVFGVGKTALIALNGIDLDVHAGEFLALVGESGSGKSLTGLSINGLLPDGAQVVSGRIAFQGQDLRGFSPRQMRDLRGRKIAMIFQDPMMTLNPVLRIETQMYDALRAHCRISRRAARPILIQALQDVGIASPAERLRAWPHELSGGMRQRVAIATALLHGPDLVIADEPTTALDVTIQGQILALVQRLCRERGVALIWITHDLAVVAGIADRVAVMYAGRVVEEGAVDAILDDPAHPYTKGLIDSVAAKHPRGTTLPMIPGRMPLLSELPAGCAFAPRCPQHAPLCAATPPAPKRSLSVGASGARMVRCHFPLSQSLEQESA